MDKQTKLMVLIKLAHLFEINHIRWELASSAMLYLRGYVNDFHDLDFMIPELEYTKVDHVLQSIGQKIHRNENEAYKTLFFESYTIDGVSVDVLAGLTILNQQKEYHFSFNDKEESDYTYLMNQKIYLSKIDDWYTYYQLMERTDKVRLIEERRHLFEENELYLKTPTTSDVSEIARFRKEFIDGDESLHGGCGLSQYDDIFAWLEYIKRFLTKEELPQGRVISSSFICIRKTDQKMVGILHLRHELDEALFLHGGHIGYSICPSERGKKYAHEQLRLGLLECDIRNINPVLITCNKDNEASRRTILHASGIKENEYTEEDGNIVERYWIKRS